MVAKKLESLGKELESLEELTLEKLLNLLLRVHYRVPNTIIAVGAGKDLLQDLQSTAEEKDVAALIKNIERYEEECAEYTPEDGAAVIQLKDGSTAGVLLPKNLLEGDIFIGRCKGLKKMKEVDAPLYFPEKVTGECT